MTQQKLAQTTLHDRYLAAFDSFMKNGAASDASWLQALRSHAIDRFAELGFPTARRGNEEWKYTDVRPIANAQLQPLVTPPSSSLSVKDIRPYLLGEPRWHRLVFVDGGYVHRLSSLPSLPEGSFVGDIAQALTLQGDLLEEHLGQYAGYGSNAFTALNTAFAQRGSFVYIPDGVVLEQPLHLVFLTTGKAQERALQPRVLVLTGRESSVTLVESFGCIEASHYLNNVVTEIVAGSGSSVKLYRLQRESQQAFHVHTTDVALARDSRLLSVALDLGGGLTRNNLNVLMREEGASCVLNGLYVIGGSQHVDNQVVVDHAKPHTTTRELYKGVLDARSRAVFHGSIVVREGATKVDARQEDKNLLLSDQAEADTKPAFWIYSDNVKCSHGAACGRLDESALFYLRSRGLDEVDARRLLTWAFVSEVLEVAHSQRLRMRLEGLVTARLEGLQRLA